MKTKTIAVIAAFGLFPIAGFAQTPPAPPVPPLPPVPPGPPSHQHDKMPKVPVTFLGVETSQVPRVLSEQMNLPKGFGLVVDYVVPDGPAAAAGVQTSDILKMLNDQILMEPDQLAKLVRSFPEGTNVTLTILRKGQETKITVKLAKREVSSRQDFFGPHGRPGHEHDMGMLGSEMENLKTELGNMNLGANIRETVRDARREALRASEQVRRAARGIRVITTTNNGAATTTKIDLGKAQIEFTDAKGELKIDTVDGKKLLTAKDPQGRLLFSGPIETKEDLDKVPAEVRQRYDKLQQESLQNLGPAFTFEKSGDNDINDDSDSDDNSEDEDNDNDNDNDTASHAVMHQVSFQAFPRSVWALNML